MKRIWFSLSAVLIVMLSLVPINALAANGTIYTFHQIDMTSVYNSKAFDAGQNYTSGTTQKYWINPGTTYNDPTYGNVPMDVRPAGQNNVWLSKGNERTSGPTFTNSITLSTNIQSAVAIWLVGFDGGWVYTGSKLQVSYKLDTGSGVQPYTVDYYPNDWYTIGTGPDLTLWVDSTKYSLSTYPPEGDIAVARIDLPQSGILSEIKVTDPDPDPSEDYYSTLPGIDSFPIFAITVVEAVVPVNVDVKPMSCPNPFNVKSKGVLPVAILGTATLDVSQIYTASVELEGIAPLRWALEDVGTVGDPLAGPDGYMDLTLKFDTQAIVGALGAVNDEDIVTLDLTGNLTVASGGIPITGDDEVVIIKK